MGLILKKQGEIHTGSYDGRHSELRMAEGLHFIPAQRSLLTQWSLGSYRCLFLEINFEELLAPEDVDPRWGSINLQASTDLKNPRILMNMRHIAQEMIAPGFASSYKIDMYVKATAVELLGHFFEAPLKDKRKPASDSLPQAAIRHLHDYVNAMDAYPVLDKWRQFMP